MANHPSRPKNIRPREHLRASGKLYPEAWEQVDMFRASKGKELPDWPDWCFLPMAAGYSIISRDSGLTRLPAHLIGDVARITALATWRVTQGIYRFDPALFPRIWETPVSGDVPVDVLYHLPEWCVYIETQDQESMHGFWAHLEWDVNHQRPELRLLLDTESDLTPVPLHIPQNQTLAECIAQAVDQAKAQSLTLGALGVDLLPNASSLIKDLIEPCVSLLLYLCSQNAEVEGQGRPGNPRPKKTKKGWRLFPANQPRKWDVGARMGAALRRAYQQQEQNTDEGVGQSKRPHVRRAHWHTYWTGSGDDNKKAMLKWLPPILVNSVLGDDLPSVVRKLT